MARYVEIYALIVDRYLFSLEQEGRSHSKTTAEEYFYTDVRFRQPVYIYMTN